MFNAIFRQAQQSVESSLHHVIDRAILAVLSLAAGGFATAAVTIYLTRRFGSEQGLLIVAGGLALIALITALVQYSSSGSRPAAPNEQTEPSASSQETGGEAARRMLSDADKDLLVSGLGAVAPFIAPRLVALLLRNLPVLMAVSALIFILSRSTSDEAAGHSDSADQQMAAAE